MELDTDLKNAYREIVKKTLTKVETILNSRKTSLAGISDKRRTELVLQEYTELYKFIPTWNEYVYYQASDDELATFIESRVLEIVSPILRTHIFNTRSSAKQGVTGRSKTVIDYPEYKKDKRDSRESHAFGGGHFGRMWVKFKEEHQK